MDQRHWPESVEGYGALRRFDSVAPAPSSVRRAETRVVPHTRATEKLLTSIDAAFEACAIRDGATLSFHHHLRNGDQVLNQVLAAAARRGLRDLTVAASSIFPVHAPLVEHMRSGVVTGLTTSYMAGPVGKAVSEGALLRPAVMTTHGGRARAIESGELHIDVAFVGAPAADRHGNLSGAHGRAACGPLGYAMVDVRHADRVVAVTDQLWSAPPSPIDVSQDLVDHVVVVESIGDPAGILTGATRPTTDPTGLRIAETAAQVIAASGLLTNGFSLQTGAGGISIATSMFVREQMRQRGVKGSFGAGGVTGTMVEMLEAGLFENIWDVQCFDLRAVESYRRDPRHLAMSASMYANPHTRGPLVERLDAMLLGATEVDLDFNVNVTTGSNGVILGGSGGHADTAAGARLALVTTKLSSSAGPKLVERVGCLTTPGETIDAVATEVGVAVHPCRVDLALRLRKAGVEVLSIGELRERALAVSVPAPVTSATDADPRVVAVVEYRDGRVTDLVHQVKR
jgi:citrate lyase subunit alpha/citrate CoA-transferase